MNTFKISYLDGSWKDIPSAVFPLNSSSLLDEKLDETYVTFYNSRKEIYPPADFFRIQRYENGTKVSDDVLAVSNDEAASLAFKGIDYGIEKRELQLSASVENIGRTQANIIAGAGGGRAGKTY